MLSSERHDPTVAGMKNMERMLRYAAGTVNLGIKYKRTHWHLSASERRMLELTVYADSDWAGDVKVAKNPQSRSRSGILMKVNEDPIFWSSKLRTVGGGDDDPVVIDLSSQSAAAKVSRMLPQLV